MDHEPTPSRLLHPSFTRPENIDTRLWRYMSAGKFKWLLEEGRLYMPRVAQLAANDSREGTMPDAQAAWLRQLADEATPEVAEIHRKNLETMAGFVRMFRDTWFVSCWHAGTSENFAFWRIYSGDDVSCDKCGNKIVGPPHSVAIVTTFRKLEACLPQEVELGLVKYIDYATEGAELSNMYDYIMRKRSYYAYENEVRAVASSIGAMVPNGSAQHLAGNIVGGSFAPRVDLAALIEEVVVHPEAPASFFDDVAALCSSHRLPLPRLSGLRNV
ncbi:DUF2971 domain-containing protein [Hyphomicrobium sp. 1Nfss2.1]|uniref:hypothetical protein n=1 Tax=Hyphomicrobium sp. 1Nfss2.1 TaxID=3413936 RepID=UPI003C7AAF37